LSKIVAITGASGFIGQKLSRKLIDLGFQVRVLVRSLQKGERLRQYGAELIEGSLACPDALEKLVTDVNAVVHCAGSVRGRSMTDFYPTNVTGVENLLDALNRHNQTAKILSLSSLAARQPELSHYAQSKHLGELAIINNKFCLEFDILRPPAIYGPGDRELLPLFQLMTYGLTLVPGKTVDRFSLIYVDDVVGAIVAWLEFGKATNEIFTISDPNESGYNWKDISDVASSVLKKRVKPWSPPVWLIDCVAKMNSLISDILGYAPMLTPEKLKELRHHDWCCNSNLFNQVTGWQSQVSFAKGLELTLGSTGKKNKTLKDRN